MRMHVNTHQATASDEHMKNFDIDIGWLRKAASTEGDIYGT